MRHLDVSASICWGNLLKDAWVPYPKEDFWRSERAICLKVSMPAKLLFVQSRDSHWQTAAGKALQWPPYTFLEHSCYDFILFKQIKVLNPLTSHKNINTHNKSMHQPSQKWQISSIRSYFFLTSVELLK